MLLQYPHDHFVREFLSDIRYAREFLSAVLPAELSAWLDWTRLRGEPATFIDENQRDQYSDLLFSIAERGEEPSQVYSHLIGKNPRLQAGETSVLSGCYDSVIALKNASRFEQ